ncbi:MAG: HAMP domain-containing histidine kinase [Deltaproteobacteria bacterium]|nr:HAMP domain-containing histidine kinase [Deltaproteobacteria bacterium]
MSLAFRIVVLLGALVLVTALLSWALAGRSIVAPLARALYESQAEQAISIAERIERGESAEALERALGLDIKVDRSSRPETWRRRSRCEGETRAGREIVHCLGRKAPVAVQSNSGWIVIRRDIDLDDPARRFARLLLISGLGVLIVGWYLARVATRPLRATRDAMGRVARGDLEHRLPESGPKELRQVAEAYNSMAQRVREMLETERRLMAGISHELRTPISRLVLELELLRDAGVSPKRLDGMERDLHEIDQLIGELLDSSRLSIGDKKLALEPVDLRQIVDEAASRIQLTHPLEVSGTGAAVRADRERLLRVVVNLLSNAEKFAPAGTKVFVTLDGRRIEVRDEGSGVPADSISRLFEPFYRVPRPDGKKGHGLGLMISKQLVELHGGSIWAKNVEGGFVVGFELPG